MPISSAQQYFEKMRVSQLHGESISERNFFGFRSLVIKGKSFVILIDKGLVIKLDEAASNRALAMKNSSRWNPFGREKKKWIVFAENNSAYWNDFIAIAGQKILKETGATE